MSNPLLPTLYGIGTVGAALFLTSRVVRRVLDRLSEKIGWYSALDERYKNETAGAVTCVMHHGLVCLGSLASLFYGNQYLFRRIMIIELGFDVYDTLATIAGHGLTGMGAVPITLHHTVALVLDYIALFTPMVPWTSSAAFAAILLGSGAIDLLMVRILRHTPLYQSPSLIYYCAAQFALFLACRVGYFTYSGVQTFKQITSAQHSILLVTVPFALLSMYHLLLGMGLIMALRNGGRMPEKPNKKTV